MYKETHDLTLKDINRRELSFTDNHYVREVLPEYFLEDYPTLVTFLEQYYEFEDSQDSVARLIHDLFVTRDITQTDLELLAYIEDELLLGQQYFQGFVDKRTAAHYSNNLYRSKGTLYSIQQFFRSFFGITPSVTYSKQFIFKIGESELGPDSQRYITDDKLYQNYALLIKSALPIGDWFEEYKLFVHPAGMYVGAEAELIGNALFNVEIVSAREDLDLFPDVVPIPPAAVSIIATSEISGIVKNTDNSQDTVYSETDLDNVRVKLPLAITDISQYTIEQVDRQYDTIAEFAGVNSATFDEDSDGTDYHTPRLSSTLDTMDEVRQTWWSTDTLSYNVQVPGYEGSLLDMDQQTLLTLFDIPTTNNTLDLDSDQTINITVDLNN